MAFAVVQWGASASPSIGGSAGREPVAIDELVVRKLAPADVEDAGGLHRRVAADEIGVAIREPLPVSLVLVAVDDLVAPPEDALEVERSGHRLGGARRLPRGGEQLRRAEQRLRRHARPVRALAADERALHERHLGSRPRAGSVAPTNASPAEPPPRTTTRVTGPAAENDSERAKSPSGSSHQWASSNPALSSSACSPSPAELVGDLRAHLLTRRELDLQVESVDAHALVDVGAEEHLDPLVLRVPARDVLEALEHRSRRRARGS